VQGRYENDGNKGRTPNNGRKRRSPSKGWEGERRTKGRAVPQIAAERKGCPVNGLKASGALRDQSTVKTEENERTINDEQGVEQGVEHGSTGG